MKLFGTTDIKRFVQDYVASLDDLEGMTVVDVPAGTGYIYHTLKEKAAAVEPYDLFPEFFECEGVQCREADLRGELPIPDSHADMVLCQEGIEHIPDQLHALQELNRILKPGGRLLLTTPNVSQLRSRLSHFLLESDLYRRMPPGEMDAVWFTGGDEMKFYFGHLFLIGAPKLRILCKLAGFRLVKILPVRASHTSLLLGLFLPFIFLAHLFARMNGMKRNRDVDREWKKSIYREMFRIGFNPNILFGKHLFWELEKEAGIDETEAAFFRKMIGRI
ncbi:methyltransferase domain-containing protein [Gemmatimonadota bacterium]